MLFFQAKTSEGPDFHKGKKNHFYVFTSMLAWPFLCIHRHMCVQALTVQKSDSDFALLKHHFSLPILLWVLGLQIPPTPHNGPLDANSRHLFVCSALHSYFSTSSSKARNWIILFWNPCCTKYTDHGWQVSNISIIQVCRNSSHPINSAPHGTGGAGCKECCILAKPYFHRIKTV